MIAVGYTMIYGVIQLINFAHGEIYMLGAFFAITFISFLGLPFYVAFLVAMACCAVCGVLLDIVAYRPLRQSPRLAALITAMAPVVMPKTNARPKTACRSSFKTWP